MRKLASVRIISEIKPIEGADKIELAKVDGWEVVVKKDEFKVGDMAIYIEVDSLLPEDNPMFEFMRERKFKVKTVKLRGQISQGILFPLSILDSTIDRASLEEGDDLTEILKIKKYEIDDDIEYTPPKKNKKEVKKQTLFRRIKTFMFRSKKEKYGRDYFPDFVKKTDENRIQNKVKEINELIEQGTAFKICEKLDGTSATYAVKRIKRFFLKDKFEFYICSRNLRLSEKEENSNSITSNHIKIAKKYDIKKRMINFAEMNELDTFYIQGEIIGHGIQKNRYKKDLDFYVFTANIDGRRVDSHLIADIMLIPSVPVINEYMRINSIEDIKKMTTFKSILNQDIVAEGIVIRNCGNEEISFKSISPEYLLEVGKN